ncbi:hypothetical protein D3C85_1282370 [compost metagenome]
MWRAFSLSSRTMAGHSAAMWRFGRKPTWFFSLRLSQASWYTATFLAISSGPPKPSTSAPMPRPPAFFSDSVLVQARYIGGCGSW